MLVSFPEFSSWFLPTKHICWALDPQTFFINSWARVWVDPKQYPFTKYINICQEVRDTFYRQHISLVIAPLDIWGHLTTQSSSNQTSISTTLRRLFVVRRLIESNIQQVPTSTQSTIYIDSRISLHVLSEYTIHHN